MRRDAFYSVHPAAAMLFFVIVTVTTALILHPVVTGCSLIAACAYAVLLPKRERRHTRGGALRSQFRLYVRGAHALVLLLELRYELR